MRILKYLNESITANINNNKEIIPADDIIISEIKKLSFRNLQYTHRHYFFLRICLYIYIYIYKFCVFLKQYINKN